MTDPSELAATLRALDAALEGAGVTWATGGSLAISAHGEPRATNDVDVVAQLDERSARAVVGVWCRRSTPTWTRPSNTSTRSPGRMGSRRC